MANEKINGYNIAKPLVLTYYNKNYVGLPNIDAKYGPYDSREECLRALPTNLRAKGLTVAIKDDQGKYDEYWFVNGIEDVNLELKVKSGQASKLDVIVVDIDNIKQTISRIDSRLSEVNLDGVEISEEQKDAIVQKVMEAINTSDASNAQTLITEIQNVTSSYIETLIREGRLNVSSNISSQDIERAINSIISSNVNYKFANSNNVADVLNEISLKQTSDEVKVKTGKAIMKTLSDVVSRDNADVSEVVEGFITSLTNKLSGKLSNGTSGSFELTNEVVGLIVSRMKTLFETGEHSVNTNIINIYNKLIAVNENNSFDTYHTRVLFYGDRDLNHQDIFKAFDEEGSDLDIDNGVDDNPINRLIGGDAKKLITSILLFHIYSKNISIYFCNKHTGVQITLSPDKTKFVVSDISRNNHKLDYEFDLLLLLKPIVTSIILSNNRISTKAMLVNEDMTPDDISMDEEFNGKFDLSRVKTDINRNKKYIVQGSVYVEDPNKGIGNGTFNFLYDSNFEKSLCTVVFKKDYQFTNRYVEIIPKENSTIIYFYDYFSGEFMLKGVSITEIE